MAMCSHTNSSSYYYKVIAGVKNYNNIMMIVNVAEFEVPLLYLDVTVASYII